MTQITVRLKKELPNLITLLRVVLTCFLNVFILNHFGSMPIPVIITGAIFLTDFLDGKIARHYGNVSPFGAVFDIGADLFYIITSYLVICFFHLLPLWFLGIILIKFGEFVITSYFLQRLGNGKSLFIFDPIGRLVAMLFYVIPLLVYLSFHYVQSIYVFTIQIFIYMITFMAAVSTTYRLWNCTRGLQSGRNEKTSFPDYISNNL